MYPAERVRRPVPEIKAVAKAVEMIRVLILPISVACLCTPFTCNHKNRTTCFSDDFASSR